jgi:hypothetical protein
MGMKRVSPLLLLCVLGCGSEQLTVGYVPSGELDAGSLDGASGADGGAPMQGDGAAEDAARTCSLPERVSLPEELTSEVQGDLLAPIVYYAGGAPLPAGRYRVSYVDGCFTCCVTIDSFVLVGDDVFSIVAQLPGGSSEGLDVAPVASCPVRGAPYPDIEFEFAGGKLGIWLSDAVATENSDGDGAGGRNPTWRLTLLEACP